MKKIAPIICFIALISLYLSSCTSESDNKASENSFTRSYPFTALDAKDVFAVHLTGEKPEEMLLDFSITTAQGDTIYSVKVKGTDLLGSTDPNVDLREEKDQIAFIKNIAKEFLSDDQFLEPAVMPHQEADSYSPDPAFYDSLKKTGLNGFMYRLGKENKYYIAYDIESKQVKVYYNCC